MEVSFSSATMGKKGAFIRMFEVATWQTMTSHVLEIRNLFFIFIFYDLFYCFKVTCICVSVCAYGNLRAAF